MVAALIGEQRSVAYCCGAVALCADYYYDDEATARAPQKQNAQSGNSGRICKLSISELLTASPTPVNIPFQVNLLSLVSWIRVPLAHQLTLANGTSAPVPSRPYADCRRLSPSSSADPRLFSETYRHVRGSVVDGRCLWISGHRTDMADMVLVIQSRPPGFWEAVALSVEKRTVRASVPDQHLTELAQPVGEVRCHLIRRIGRACGCWIFTGIQFRFCKVHCRFRQLPHSRW